MLLFMAYELVSLQIRGQLAQSHAVKCDEATNTQSESQTVGKKKKP